MSGRIRTAEQSARREAAITKETMLTMVADSTAPRDPKSKAEHYRRHLTDAHRVIETLQQRMKEVEQERDKIKEQARYNMSICVTRGEAEKERLAAFRLARGKAAILAETKDGVPTSMSHAIDQIPDPKPMWSK